MATAMKPGAVMTKVKWELEADFLQACNCDYGCPCEFEAPPTKGFCEGIGAWRITQGAYGTVKLDGLGFGFTARWPGPLHQGNGTAALFFDKQASPEQRQALLAIASGQAGGMPFEVIAATFSKVLEPRYVPFAFTIKGKHSSVKIGDAATIAVEPIKNPVTGQPESIRVEHETGFIFKSAECVSSTTCQAAVDGLTFSWPGKSAFVAKVKYAN